MQNAKQKCLVHVCFINDAAFFPDHLPGRYPDIVQKAQSMARNCGALVMDGVSYCGKIKRKNPTHFHSESVKLVVEMFSEAFAPEPSFTKPCPPEVFACDPSLTIPSTVSSHMDIAQSSDAEESAPRPIGIVSGPCSSLVRNGVPSDVQKGHATENTSFRYIRFAEWQGRFVTRDMSATVKEPDWLIPIYETCAYYGYTPVIQNPPLMNRTPMFISDQRFELRQRDKVFKCDSCRNIVPYSSVKRNTGSRAEYTFAGSYLDHSWALSIPGECLYKAWANGLIDCTWHCHKVCGAPVTGAGKDRQTRTANWQKRNGWKWAPGKGAGKHRNTRAAGWQKRNWRE